MDQADKPVSDMAQSLRRRLLIAPAAIVSILLVIGTFQLPSLTTYYAGSQDVPLLALVLMILAFASFGGTDNRPLPVLDARRVWGLAGLLGLIAWAGHYLILAGYNASRDEQMADFDARIFASGRLVQPLAEQWRDIADVLNTTFLTPLSHPGALVSAYLPGNAALRALVGMVGDAALTGPLLFAGSIVLVWRCARLLWPDDREAASIAVVTLALSGQALFTAMTAYAMTAHLFFNLLWLWLFLRDRRGSDVAALAVGFVATGLHQPLFHPMFVAPWLALLLWQRRWGRLALFTIGYAAIGLFWLSWPGRIAAMVATSASVANAAGTDYLTRLRYVLAGNQNGLALMADNLLRFFTWQPALLLPLLGAALPGLRRDCRVMALAGGLALTIAVMTILLPYQGHGFGYRYVHGLLGSTALLAGFGWLHLARTFPRMKGVLVRSSIASALLLLPLQGWFAHKLYSPYARLDARIAASEADYALLSSEDGPYTADLILNRADLSNRPIRLDAWMVTEPAALAVRICKPGTRIAMATDRFYTPIAETFASSPEAVASPRAARWTPLFTAAGCKVETLD